MSSVCATAAAVVEVPFLGMYGGEEGGIPIYVVMIFVKVPDGL